jgi:hypothetical protein
MGREKMEAHIVCTGPTRQYILVYLVVTETGTVLSFNAEGMHGQCIDKLTLDLGLAYLSYATL